MEKVVYKHNLGEEPNDLEYWLTKTPQERLSALEIMRDRYIKLAYNGVKPKFQKVITFRNLSDLK